ncbi:MAG: phosphatase PAP2 family protein [Candidatus Kapabacteria bacterium]|nr:phosphatase PAP2 family protein [Candidatus Kapabacteria bacterium]
MINYFKKIILDNRFFFICYTFFLLIGAICIVLLTKGQLLLFLNKNHNPVLDIIFYLLTLMGDGYFSVLICIILLFYKRKVALSIILAYITSGLFSQIIKHIVHSPRPKAWFGNSINLYFINWIDIYSNFSFPSGHSTSAFSLFLILSVLVKNKKMGLLFFFLAFGIGISRIYLAQHFFEDVYGGSLIGVITALLILFYTDKSPKFQTTAFNLPLLKFPLQKHKHL